MTAGVALFSIPAAAGIGVWQYPTALVAHERAIIKSTKPQK